MRLLFDNGMSVVPPFLVRFSALSLLYAGTALAQVAPGATADQHLQRAHAFLAQHKPQDAIPEFRAALAANPSNADAAGNLGVLLYFAGDYAGSEPLLQQAVRAEPLPKLQALLGFCERRNNQPEEARRNLAAALPGIQEPAIRRQAGLELIELDTAAGDLPAAAAVASRLKAAAPEDPVVLYAAYRVYTDLAEEAILDLSVAAPNSAQMYQAMAHELAHQRDDKGAVANYRAALAADPTLPGIHYELAEALRLAPEPALKAEAEQQYALAVQENPRDARALARLGDFAAERGEHDKAIGLYRQAIQFSPSDTNAGLGLAHELVETNQLEPALVILRGLERTDPTDVLVHFRLAALYRRLHKPEEARREVAEYDKYKAIKEKLRVLYHQMRTDAPDDPKSQP